MITTGTLVAGGLSPSTAEKVCADLVAACDKFDISTATRQGAFIAQCAVESALFARTEENLNYTTPGRILAIFPSKVRDLNSAKPLVSNPSRLANVVYAGVNGNSPDPLVGDGYRFRGRGYIQITGKSNYAAAARDCEQPYVDDPDLVSKIPGACLSAASYWDRNGCSQLADREQWDAITRAINGRAMLDHEKRVQLTLDFIKAFS